MPIGKQSNKFFFAGSIAALLLVFSAGHAQAQLPWGYSPMTGSNSWLWLSRSLYTPSNFLFRNGSYGAGSYLANTLAYQAAHGVGQGINSMGKRKAMKQFYANPANGINAPAVDQISTAPWYYPPRGVNGPIQGVAPTQGQTGQPAFMEKDPFADPLAGNFMPVPAMINDDAPSTTPITNPLTSPPPASNPDPVASKKSKSVPSPAPDFRPSTPLDTSTAQVGSASNNPFAQAFVDHINDKYSGDISKAFADKQTKAYARALGILESNKLADLPADRLELIQKILKDPQEDSLTKVNTIRLLIKH